MAEKVGLKDIPPIASSEDLSDESPVRDYIAPQTPRIDISLTNSLQRDSCDSDIGLGLESGLNEDSIMSDDLKSSNEELTYIDPQELQMRKKSHSNTMSNKEDESETMRKASSCSDCGLLTITGAGRDSRISSTASLISVASNASHLSSTSNASRLSTTSNLSKASRGSSPHRLLLETSFCGPPSPMNETKSFVRGAVEKKFVKSEEIINERKIISEVKTEPSEEDIIQPNDRIKPQLDNPKMQKYIPLKYSLDRDEESIVDARKVDIGIRAKNKSTSSRQANNANLADDKMRKFIPLKYSLDENGEKKTTISPQPNKNEQLEPTKSGKELPAKNCSVVRGDTNYDQDAKNLSIDPRTQKFIPLKYSLDKGDENHRSAIPNANPKPPRKFIGGIAQDIRSENKQMENTAASENRNYEGRVKSRDINTRVESGTPSAEERNIATLPPKGEKPIVTSPEKDERAEQKIKRNAVPSVNIEAPDIDPRTQKFIPLKYSVEREDSRDYCKTSNSSSINQTKKDRISQIYKPPSEFTNQREAQSKFTPDQYRSEDNRGGTTTKNRPSVSKDQRFVPLQYSVDSAGNSKTSSPKTNPNSPRRLKPFTNRTILNFLAKYDRETDSLRPAAIPSSPIKDEFIKFMTLPDYDDPSSGSIRRTKSMSHTERKSVSKSREEQSTEIVKAFSANAGLNEIPPKRDTEAISVKVQIHESPTKGISCGEIYGNSLSVNESTMGERSYSNDEGRIYKLQQDRQQPTRTVRSMSHLGATETEKVTPSFLEIGSDAVYRRCSESARNISGESGMSKSRSGSIKSLFTSIFRRSSSVKSQKQPRHKSSTGVITVNRASPRSEFPPVKGLNNEPDQIFIPLHSPDEKSSNKKFDAEGNTSSKLPSEVADETQAQYNSVLAEFQQKNFKTDNEDSDGNSYCEGVAVPVQQVNVVIHHLSRPQTPEQIVIQEQSLDMQMPNQSQIEAHLDKLKSEAIVKRAQSDDNNNRVEMSGNESTQESVESDGGTTIKSVKSLVEKFESTSSSSSIERKQRKMKREVGIEHHPEDGSTRTEITESAEILESLVVNESPTNDTENYEQLPYLPTTLPLERRPRRPL